MLRKHTVRYDGDPDLYEEDLISGVFQIWDGQGATKKVDPASSSTEVMVWLHSWTSVRGVSLLLIF